MGVLERQIYKKIEWHLYNYFNLKREVNEAKEEIINAGERSYRMGWWYKLHSDPTA